MLGNKADLPGALTTPELIARMGLANVGGGREVAVYSISCKDQTNLDITLQWLTKHAKS